MASALIYFSLLVFSGFVVYDTQEIIERFDEGDRNFALHAVILLNGKNIHFSTLIVL